MHFSIIILEYTSEQLIVFLLVLLLPEFLSVIEFPPGGESDNLACQNKLGDIFFCHPGSLLDNFPSHLFYLFLFYFVFCCDYSTALEN